MRMAATLVQLIRETPISWLISLYKIEPSVATLCVYSSFYQAMIEDPIGQSQPGLNFYNDSSNEDGCIDACTNTTIGSV